MILCAATVRRSGEPGPAPTSVMRPPFGRIFDGLDLRVGSLSFCLVLLSLLLVVVASLMGARGLLSSR